MPSQHPKKHRCPHCRKAFAEQVSMYQHMEALHGKPLPKKEKAQ